MRGHLYDYFICSLLFSFVHLLNRCIRIDEHSNGTNERPHHSQINNCKTRQRWRMRARNCNTIDRNMINTWASIQTIGEICQFHEMETNLTLRKTLLEHYSTARLEVYIYIWKWVVDTYTKKDSLTRTHTHRLRLRQYSATSKYPFIVRQQIKWHNTSQTNHNERTWRTKTSATKIRCNQWEFHIEY